MFLTEFFTNLPPCTDFLGLFEDIPQKVDNIHQANVLRILAFLPFSFSQKFSFSFCSAFG